MPKKAKAKGETNQPKSAYFLSVSLKNVLCFGPEQTLDLSDGNGHPARWTVILGDNGTGKTTLLRAMAILKSTNRVNLAEGETIDLRPEYTVSKRFEITAQLYFGSGLGVTSGNSKNTQVTCSQAGWRTSRELFEQALICYAYGASRRMGAGPGFGERTEREDPALSLFSDNTALEDAEEWLLQADYNEHRLYIEQLKNRAQIPSGVSIQEAQDVLELLKTIFPNNDVALRLNAIKNILIDLLPDVEDIRFTTPGSPSLLPKVEFKTPYGWVKIGQLSLGYRTMIAWTVDVARRLYDRYPDSPNPLAEPAIILVDEIDLHLHPRWQRSLMTFLSERFPNAQFIVTAHSPLVVQSAENANVVLLRREDDHIVIDNDVETIRNWRVDQVLTSDLFGLQSARSPHVENKLAERSAILAKGKLTAADRKKLQQLEAEIGDLPVAETSEDIHAMDIIRRAAQRLNQTP